ncbi:MAG: site-specific integrase [Alphaproteobacteria bacterium]|nr:site-specific integrase [Alphaproteobacteria bacterium]
MSLFRPKGSQNWYFDFTFRGVRHYGPTGVSNKTEAKGIEAAHKTRIAHEHAFGKPKSRPPMAIKEAFGRYDAEVGQHIATTSADLQRMDVLLTLLGADTPLSDITDDTLAQLVARLRSRTVSRQKEKRLVAASTVNRYLELYRRVWRRAAKTWKVDCGDEPGWSDLLLPEADERIRSLSADEEARLFKHLRPDYHAMVRFALRTGMRLGNIRGLRWRDVDFDTATVSIRMKSRKPGGRHHVVPLTPDLVALLKAEIGRHFTYVFTYECEKPRRIKGADGKPLQRLKGGRYPFSRDGWRRAWADALAGAGIEDFRFHDTRHTAATRIVRATGNIKVAKELLGHTSIATTSRYAHVDQADVRAALTAVSQAITKVGGGDDENSVEDQVVKTA